MSALCVVGGGRMGTALVAGLVRSGAYRAEDITVVDPDPVALESLRATLGVTGVDEPVAAEDVVLAIKPTELERACLALRKVGATRVLSIVAGAKIAAMENLLGPATRVVRSMPNTPSVVGAGASAIAGGASAKPEDMDWAESILGAVGVVVRVPETSIDAVTGLSGSGPAYVFLIAEALIEAGVVAGLNRATAITLASETLRGASELLVQSGESPSALRAQVTSPGGTTEAGLAILEERGVRAAILDAVAAAAARSRELGTPV